MVKGFTTHNLFKSWIFWACAALFYFFQFILRVSPSVMMGDLMQHFHMTAAAVGLLASCYYHAYTLFQIPTGLLVDKWGPKRIILIYGVVCLAGTVLFAWAPNAPLAYTSRLLIGAGSVAGFIGSSRVIRDVFPPAKVGLLMSLTMTVGTLGGLAGELPTALLVERMGWQKAMWGMAGLGVVVVALIAWFLRDAPHYKQPRPPTNRSPLGKKPPTSLWQGLFLALKTPQIWIASFCAAGVYIPLSVLADLWGPHFLMANYHLPRSTAASLVSFSYVGLCVGSIAFAWLAEKISNRKLLINLGLVAILFFMGVLLYVHLPSPFWIAVCSFCLGASTGAEMLCYTHALHDLPPQYGGVAVSVMTMSCTLVGAALQWAIGYVMDVVRAGRVTEEGQPLYLLYDYQVSLTLVMGVIALAWLVSFALRPQTEEIEPYCIP